MKWMNLWGYLPLDYRSQPCRIRDHQQRITIRSNNQAERLRLCFSNRWGISPLLFSAITISVNGGECYPVTKDGKLVIRLLPEEEYQSDVVPLGINPGDFVEIVTSLSEAVTLTCGIMTYSRQEQQFITSDPGNGRILAQEDSYPMVKENPGRCFAYGLCGLDGWCHETQRLVTAFGDSLTQQGYWTDHLKLRFRQNNQQIAVLNRGIGGSRVLYGTDLQADVFELHGGSGTQRFEGDCYAAGQPDGIIVCHGINDLITGCGSERELIAGLELYAKIAHRQHTRILIATLAPLGRSIFYNQELEQKRQVVNGWIRSQSCYDRVLDFDRALRCQGDETMLDDNYDSGDGIHFSDAGGRAAAKCVDIDKIIEEAVTTGKSVTATDQPRIVRL